MKTAEHLLACLNEECCEVAQDVDKSLRFGLQDRNVLNPTGPTNLERLVVELNQLVAVVDILVEQNILPADWQNLAVQSEKKAKVWKFVEYAKSVGAIQLDAIASHQTSLKSLLARWEAQSLELQFQSANCSVDPLLAGQKAELDAKDWMLRECISELGKVLE